MKFTEDDWKDFESLIFSMLSDLLKKKYGDIKGVQTQLRKDGGFDGRFYLSEGYEELLSSEKSMLFEVKLRNTKRKDLPLNDFSKSIIIAINMAANALTVATNLDFSATTIELISSFSEKTGLVINKLNGNNIRNWLNSNVEYYNNFSNKKLLNFLKKSTDGVNSLQEAPFKIVFRQSDHNSEFINMYRKKKCEEIANFLSNTSNSIILSGEAGVGKSFLLDKILDNLVENNVQCISLSLRYSDTPRTFFIRLLSNIWHISEDYLLGMEMEDLREAVSQIGNNKTEEELIDVILCSFEKSTQELTKRADVFNRYIILYLKKLLYICNINKKMVLSISNANVATIELLDFICQLSEELIKNIQLILEIRTSEYLGIDMDSEKWHKYEKRLKTLNNGIHDFEIKKLNHTESYEFIEALIKPKKLTIETKEFILKYTGNNPLYIQSFIDYIKLSYDFQNVPEELLPSIISSFHFDNKLEIVDLLINRLSEKNPICMQIFLLLKFFDGNVKENVIKDILNISIDSIPSELFESEIIFVSKERIRTSHLIYQEIIDQSHYASYTNIKIIADKILSEVESYEKDSEKLFELKFKLYKAKNCFEDMINNGFELIKYKYLHGQYSICSKYVDECINVLDKIFHSNDYTVMKIQLLEYEINIEFYNKKNIKNVEKNIQILNEIFNNNVTNEFKQQKLYFNLFVSYLLIMNQYYHHIGKFNDTYITICNAKKYIKKHKEYISKFLIESVWVEFLIAEKEIKGITSAIKQSKTALKECKNSTYLEFTINTLNYTYYNNCNPRLALNNVEKNINLYADLAVAEIYHNKVHYLNARFNMKNQDNIGLLEEAKKLLLETDKVGLKNETGRIENIIGNIYFSQGNVNKAKEFYEFGIKNFSESTYISNEWPIIANYCCLLFEINNSDALIYWRNVIDIMLEHYKERINIIDFKEDKFPKYFAVFYILFIQCDKIFNDTSKKIVLPYFEKIRKNINLPQILELLDAVEKRNFVIDPKFDLSIYVHNGHYIIGY